MLISLFISFTSGILTVLAPCVLPLLPLIIGSSVRQSKQKDLFLIIISLSVSVFFFTILLRTTLRFNPILISLDDRFWRSIAGTIIAIFGLVSLFPAVWNGVSQKFNLQNKADSLLDKSVENKSKWAPVLLGLSLGPVFSSCSPTYFVIVGLLLAEADFAKGLILLVMYILGLGLVLLSIGLTGRRLIKKFGWLANPQGWFKKIFAIFLIGLGISIIFNLDKQFETYLLDLGFYNGLQGFENWLTQDGARLL